MASSPQEDDVLSHRFVAPDDSADYTVRGMLFLSSYAILFALLALVLWPSGFAFACAALAVFGVLVLVVLLRMARRGSPDPYEVANLRDAGSDVAGYLVGYLLPVLASPIPGIRDLVAYAAFLIVVGIVYVRSDLVHINPLLYVFGYRVFSIEISGGRDRFLIARNRPSSGQHITASHLTERLLIRHRSDDLHVEVT